MAVKLHCDWKGCKEIMDVTDECEVRMGNKTFHLCKKHLKEFVFLMSKPGKICRKD